MVAANLILNKVLQTKQFDIIKNNSLVEEQFTGYESEFKFIVDHYKKYGNVPDEMPFAEKFPDFEVFLVNETDDYLVDKLHEEYGWRKFTEIMPTFNAKLKEDSRLAYDFLRDNMSNLKPHTVCKGFDIISGAEKRYEEYLSKKTSTTAPTISTGFVELDDVFGGWEYGEELVTIVARTNAGKSWLAVKFLLEAWKQGKRVGLYSGEMSDSKLGYRFDAMLEHFSNRCLVRGAQVDGYKEYIDRTKQIQNPFLIITQKDLGGRPTVQQLRNFVEENKLDILGVDQLSLMSDGRAGRNDPPRIRLAHITEDLFLLSTEYKIPIIALAQANRASVNKENEMDAPGLENIKESDDIAHNSSKCIGMRQFKGRMILDIIKNREGAVGQKIAYTWDIDTGHFAYVPIDGDAVSDTTRNEIKQVAKKEVDAFIGVAPF